MVHSIQPLHAPKIAATKPTDAAATQHKALIEQTQKWVSQTFYGTMLKQMRNSAFHSDLFEGGHGGQAFNEMFDQKLAERMGHSAGATKLVDSIVRKIEKTHGRMPKTTGSAAHLLSGMKLGR